MAGQVGLNAVEDGAECALHGTPSGAVMVSQALLCREQRGEGEEVRKIIAKENDYVREFNVKSGAQAGAWPGRSRGRWYSMSFTMYFGEMAYWMKTSMD